MVIIGGRPVTRAAIPNNRGMAPRANSVMEKMAITKAEHFETSLGVDAPLFYFWSSTAGSLPCTCSASRLSPNRDIDPGEPTKTETDDRTGQLPKFTTIDMDATSVKEIFSSKRNLSMSVRDKLENDAVEENAFEETEELDVVFEDDNTTNFDDPFGILGNGRVIDCPICLGTGFIDSWNLHGGKRVVLDSTNAYDFYCEGVYINNNSSPNTMVAEKNAKVFWNLKLPKVWDSIVRLNVYEGTNVVPPHKYKWIFQDNLGNIRDVNIRNLNQYNGQGNNIKLSLALLEPDMQITHAEIIFAFVEARKAQIPEIAQAYELEFLDVSVSLTIELPPDLDIKEGNYLTESKYRKVWKVSVLTRKVTAGETTYGLSADCRALHSFERDFAQLSIFSTPYSAGNLDK